MAISFPQNPTIGDTYVVGDNTFVFDGALWTLGATAGTTFNVQLNTSITNTAPSNPNPGDIWLNATTGQGLVYFNDGDTQQWVDIGQPGPAGATGYTGSRGSPGELITWAAAQTASFTAAANFNYIVDTTNNALTVTLPSSPQYGDHVKIADGGGNATTNNITITSAGNIMGTGDDFLLDLNWSAVQLVYYNATKGWIITGTS